MHRPFPSPGLRSFAERGPLQGGKDEKW
eukprot:COSAG02_NODE_27782_length_602_cov_1.709742_2_plen_27_part_01